jgi:hypothetical protein
MVVEEAPGEEGEDQSIGGGVGREGGEVFGGGDGAGEHGGAPLGGGFGQFGAQPAAGVPGGDQNEAFLEVQRPSKAIFCPIFGQNGHGGGQGRRFPPHKVPGDCHGAKNRPKTGEKSIKMGQKRAKTAEKEFEAENRKSLENKKEPGGGNGEKAGKGGENRKKGVAEGVGGRVGWAG